MEKETKKLSFSKDQKKIIIVACGVMLVTVIAFIALLLYKHGRPGNEFSNGYTCITDGFDDTKIEDEEGALKAINKIMRLVGLTDPENELKVVGVYTIGNDTYYKFQQYHDEVPIQGNLITLVVNDDGIASSVTATTESYKEPEKEKKRTEEDYINAALKHIKYDKVLSKLVGDKEYVPDKNHNITLSYPVKLVYLYKEQIHAKILYISSIDLSVLKEVDLDKSDLVLPSIEDTEEKVEEETEDLLVDKERNILCGYISGSVDNVKNTIAEKSDSECLTAYENMQKIYDYFGNTLGIKSFDNAGSGIYLMLSQYGYLTDKTSSSLFEKREAALNYGAIVLGEPATLYTERPINAIDMIAYEYAQQMMRNIVLIEDAFMREAIGDIFGNLAELQITSEEADWKVGENSGYVKYDMSNSVTMKDYDKNNKGYRNTAILAHTAYLMSNGIDGEESMKISPETLTSLWYRALFLLPADATYAQCRNAVEVSADAMVVTNELTEGQRRCISAAFDEVLIGQAAYTNAKTMKNQFSLSVCDKNSNEEVAYELTIYQIDTLEHTEEAMSPKKVYKTAEHDGAVELELEDGVYEVIITDPEINDVSKDVKKKIIVDGSSEEASDVMEVSVKFGGEKGKENSKTVEEYIAESNQLLEDGKLKAAVLSLYECQDVWGESDVLQKAIDDYFERVTLTTTLKPDVCEDEYCFEDTTYPTEEYTIEKDMGLVLFDSQNGIRETIACITLKYEEEYLMSEQEDEIAYIDGNNGDTWLFNTATGPGKFSSFMYTIHTNKLFVLENAPIRWYVSDEILIGETVTFAVGDICTIYAYDWEGDLLYSKENVLGGKTVKEGWLYFAKETYHGEKSLYEIYKVQLDGQKEERICMIETKSGCVVIDGDYIRWWENGQDKKMSLYEPHDVTY